MVEIARQKSLLSQPRKQLLELMQRLNFGRIEALPVWAGEPLLSPAPKIVREVKFGGENGPRPEVVEDDYHLKHQVLSLLSELDHLQNGKIDCLEVKHGLPFRMILENQQS